MKTKNNFRKLMILLIFFEIIGIFLVGWTLYIIGDKAKPAEIVEQYTFNVTIPTLPPDTSMGGETRALARDGGF